MSADHIIPATLLAQRSRLDLFFDVRNLRCACRVCNSRRGAQLVNASRRGRPRARRGLVSAEQAATEWARRENAYWASVEREQERQAPTPRIY